MGSGPLTVGSGQCLVSSYGNSFMYVFLIENYLVLVTAPPTTQVIAFYILAEKLLNNVKNDTFSVFIKGFVNVCFLL